MPRRRLFLAKLYKKVVGNDYTWTVLASCFLIGSGLLMEHNGVKEFPYADKHGKAQTASPDILYITGGIFLVGTLISAILYRMDELKTERAKTGAKHTLLPEK